MIKNVKSVIVPNTDHLKGIPAAAAAGIVAGDPKKELEEFLQTTPVEVEHIDNGITFDIIVTLTRGTDTSMVRIANYHTNVVHIEKNGEVIRDIPVNGEEEEGLTDRSLLDMEHIWDFIHTVCLLYTSSGKRFPRDESGPSFFRGGQRDGCRVPPLTA